jgi:hypothetical protein
MVPQGGPAASAAGMCEGGASARYLCPGETLVDRSAYRFWLSLPGPRVGEEVTLGASSAKGVFGSMSVRVDCGADLRARRGDEVDAVLQRGGKICEFLRLAIERCRDSTQVLGTLFHLACIYAAEVRGATDLFVEVGSRHADFYRRRLGFTPSFADERNARASAALLHLSLPEAARRFESDRRGICAARATLYRFALSAAQAAEASRRMRLALSGVQASPDAAEKRPRFPWVGTRLRRSGTPAAADAPTGADSRAPSNSMFEIRSYEDGLRAGAVAWMRREAIGAYQRVGIDDYARGFRQGYFVNHLRAADEGGPLLGRALRS